MHTGDHLNTLTGSNSLLNIRGYILNILRYETKVAFQLFYSSAMTCGNAKEAEMAQETFSETRSGDCEEPENSEKSESNESEHTTSSNVVAVSQPLR